MSPPDPILITGAARSGTSLTAGIVHRCGAFGGVLRPPNPANPRGMYENRAIVEGIVKPYLASIGADPMGQDPLPDTWALKPLPELGRKVAGILRAEGYTSGPWYYKGAKTCLVWPLFHEAFPTARWIIVRRETDGIVDSCLRTPFMRAFKGREGWRAWVKCHEHRFAEMRRAGLAIREVWPARAVAGDLSEMREAVEWAGLTWDEPAVRAFVAAELWDRARRD